MTGVSTLLLIYLLYINYAIPHTRPHYQPVKDSIVLHIDNVLLFLFNRHSCKEFMQIFWSKFIILIILHLLLTVVESPVSKALKHWNNIYLCVAQNVFSKIGMSRYYLSQQSKTNGICDWLNGSKERVINTDYYSIIKPISKHDY